MPAFLYFSGLFFFHPFFLSFSHSMAFCAFLFVCFLQSHCCRLTFVQLFPLPSAFLPLDTSPIEVQRFPCVSKVSRPPSGTRSLPHLGHKVTRLDTAALSRGGVSLSSEGGSLGCPYTSCSGAMGWGTCFSVPLVPLPALT